MEVYIRFFHDCFLLSIKHIPTRTQCSLRRICCPNTLTRIPILFLISITPPDDWQRLCVPEHRAWLSSVVHRSWCSGCWHVPTNPSQTPDQHQHQGGALQSNASDNGTCASPPATLRPLRTPA